MVTEPSRTQFTMVYDGPALAEGRMSIRDLAPAMLGIGALFEAANRVSNGPSASINVSVRAPSRGSFEIVFEVAQVATQVPLSNFGDVLATATELKELIIGGGAASSLIALIRWTRGKRPRVTKINDELYTLTVDDQTYEVPLELLRLYRDAAIRRSMSEIVKPLGREGIDIVEFRRDRTPIETIVKDEVNAFDAPEIQELLVDEVRRQAFSIISLAFKEDNKWRLTDGQSTFSVAMRDDAFQRRVDSNEVAFAKGDVLVCDLRTTSWQVREGVKTEYEVVNVVSHRVARQLSMLTDDVSQAADSEGEDPRT